MNNFYKDLCNQGNEGIRSLLTRSETFELEFKRKEDSTSHRLSKGDKKNLGKALSGFSNADGGIVVYGIGTKKQDGVDVAVSLQPITDIQKFKNEIDGILGEILKPANPAIKTCAISESKTSTSGFLLIKIGQSELRPHMSNAPGHQKYFRRSFDGTIVMDHSFIRDLMMAPKEAKLRPKWRMVHRWFSGHQGKRIMSSALQLYLENTGYVMASMPYARVLISPTLDYEFIGDVARSSIRQDLSVVHCGTGDDVVHPSDEILFGKFFIYTSVDLSQVRQEYLDNDWRGVSNPKFWNFWQSYDRSTSMKEEFEELDISVTFGAKNAQKCSETLIISKSDLIKFSLLQSLAQLDLRQCDLDCFKEKIGCDEFGDFALSMNQLNNE